MTDKGGNFTNPVRMLTADEACAIDTGQALWKEISAIQHKFCEVNGLTIGQPAPAVQEPNRKRGSVFVIL